MNGWIDGWIWLTPWGNGFSLSNHPCLSLFFFFFWDMVTPFSLLFFWVMLLWLRSHENDIRYLQIMSILLEFLWLGSSQHLLPFSKLKYWCSRRILICYCNSDVKWALCFWTANQFNRIQDPVCISLNNETCGDSLFHYEFCAYCIFILKIVNSLVRIDCIVLHHFITQRFSCALYKRLTDFRFRTQEDGWRL